MIDLATQPPTEADITAAYRLFLSREPDPVGKKHYLDAAQKGELTVAQLTNAFMTSPEYLGGADAPPLAFRRTIVEVEIDGYSVFVDRDEPEFGRFIARTKVWEPHIVATLKEHLREGDVYVDVGSNVGVMAFAAAKLVGPAGKVIGFEPNEYNGRMFLRGIARNGFDAFVRLYPLALSDKPGVRALSGSSNTYLVPSEMSARLTQCVPADDLLAGEARIDFVKIDIEGHEPFALAGMRHTLAAHKPIVLSEFNPRCLKEYGAKHPEDFARQLFELASEIDAIEHSGKRNKVVSARELIDLWAVRNREAVQTDLPDGMLHFDLLFRVGKA